MRTDTGCAVDRRTFLAGAGAVGAALAAPRLFGGEDGAKPEGIRGMFLNLGHNMWSDRAEFEKDGPNKGRLTYTSASDTLRCDDAVWLRLTDRMAEKGLNTLVIDLGEGCAYPSHPELAVKGTWSVEKMRAELARLRGMGIEPVPKLNFSTSHDTWLKHWGRMVSTQEYYRTCADVIRDVCEIFDRPRLFHLGYDEETAGHQSNYDFCVVRRGELWWHDFMFFVKTVEDLGMRPWIWSDYAWKHKDEFVAKMPKSVLQSNWYYRQWFDFETIPKDRYAHLETFVTLEKAGFEQVPTGSNWVVDENMSNLVKFCRERIAPERLKGFLMTTWGPTMPDSEAKLAKGIDLAAAAFSQGA